MYFVILIQFDTLKITFNNSLTGTYETNNYFIYYFNYNNCFFSNLQLSPFNRKITIEYDSKQRNAFYELPAV